MPQGCSRTCPAASLPKGIGARIAAGFGDRLGDQCGGGNVNIVGYFQVAENDRPPSHGAVAADSGAPRDPNAACKSTVLAYPHVVPDLNLIIQFDAIFYDC